MEQRICAWDLYDPLVWEVQLWLEYCDKFDQCLVLAQLEHFHRPETKTPIAADPLSPDMPLVATNLPGHGDNLSSLWLRYTVSSPCSVTYTAAHS